MVSKKVVVCLLALFHLFQLSAFGPKTLVAPRSQSLFLPREHTGWDELIYRPCKEDTSATIAVAPTYQHSFWTDAITESLLGCNRLLFSGSQHPCRNECDILADYWGLPSDFLSEVCFNPDVAAFLMDIDFYIELDGICPGLFAQIDMPIVHARWDLELRECVGDMGSTFTSYPAGYFAPEPIELSTLTSGESAPKNVMQAFQGNATFGDMRKPLKYGKIFGRQSETRVSDLRLALGYNYIANHFHVGASVRAAAPTGTLRKSEFFFEPIIGNDHHWELGAGLSGHVDICWSKTNDRHLGLYFDSVVTHMFDSTQKRSFDLIENGCGSRYILLQQLAAPVSNLNVGTMADNDPSPLQYQGRLQPAINKTTLDATIGIQVQAEAMVKLHYYACGWEYELGYDLWYRSEEKLKCRDCIEDCWAVKGDAQVYGFTDPGEVAVGLAATQSKATINAGQLAEFDGFEPGNFNEGFEFANLNADSPANAFDDSNTAMNQLTLADADRLGISQIAVRSSNPPILVDNCDIDECSALLPKALSHTIFFTFAYTLDKPDLCHAPFVGGGASVEFGSRCLQDNSALSQWSLWLRMGVSL